MMDKSLPSLDEKQKTQNVPLKNSLNKDFLQNARERVRKRTLCQQIVIDNESEPEHNLLRKFRVVARMVKNQLVWFRNLKDAEEHLKTCIVDEDESLVFNVSAFRPDVQCFSNLTQNAKALLIKPSWMRSIRYQMVTLMLVDQNKKKNIIQCFKPEPSSSSFWRPQSEMNVASGCPKFAPLNFEW